MLQIIVDADTNDACSWQNLWI